MSAEISDEQEIQETEYDFPYHYISEFRKGFNQTYNWTWGLYHASAMEFLLGRVEIETFSSLADIGCGDGRWVRELARCHPDKSITGIDYSKKVINLAKALNPSLDFRCADINREPLNETFDILTLIEVLEHIPIPLVDDFVESAAKLLQPGGTLIMTVPHLNKPLEDKHFQHFSVDSIKRITGKQFRITHAAFFERISLLPKIINKILTNRVFILNHSGLKTLLYNSYKKWLFAADNHNCARIFFRLEKR